MKTLPIIIIFIIFGAWNTVSEAQNTSQAVKKSKVEVYYFHPNERCPIDEAIEENTIKLVRTDFKQEVADGLLKLQVLNTDDPANNDIVAQFDINTQALYVVRNVPDKEEKNNLTDFAFANAKNNPAKFMDRLKEEIVRALK